MPARLHRWIEGRVVPKPRLGSWHGLGSDDNRWIAGGGVIAVRSISDYRKIHSSRFASEGASSLTLRVEMGDPEACLKIVVATGDEARERLLPTRRG